MFAADTECGHAYTIKTTPAERDRDSAFASGLSCQSGKDNINIALFFFLEFVLNYAMSNTVDPCAFLLSDMFLWAQYCPETGLNLC